MHFSGCLLTTDIYYLNVRINVDALALLPEDGNLNGLHSITLASTIDDPEPLSAQNEDPYDAHLSVFFVPSTTQRMTEQETVRQSVQERQPHQQQVSSPMVSLPPSGAIHIVAPPPLAVTVGNYFKHLLMYTDGRFARHPRFRYFALNTEMRWRALQAGRINVRQHPHDAQLYFFDFANMVVIRQYYYCSSITSTETQTTCSLRLAPIHN